MSININCQVAIGKTLDEVEEIVILLDKRHDKIPRVKIIEYRVPATNGKLSQKINGIDVNKGYTTGALKGDKSTTNFIKTIYDPVKISDAQVIQYGKEAMQEESRDHVC